MVERWTEAPCAAGSIPARPINGRYASGLKRAVCKTVGSCLRGFKSHPADLTVLYIYNILPQLSGQRIRLRTVVSQVQILPGVLRSVGRVADCTGLVNYSATSNRVVHDSYVKNRHLQMGVPENVMHFWGGGKYRFLWMKLIPGIRSGFFKDIFIIF